MGQNPNILWSPADPVQVDESALPPQEIYNEALSHLLITLSSRTQRQAAFRGNNQALVEPTFGLYCPLEGGDYVLDNTVRALARQVDADVVVIDCAQLAAGEWGVFDAECVQLSRNPLHVSEASTSKAPSFVVEEDDGEDDSGLGETFDRPVIVTTEYLPVPRAISSKRAPPPPPPRSRLFFDQVVNAMRPSDRYVLGRPRIIYVRDFGLLASQSSAWMPSLVDAVRERRRTPSARPMSPIPNPTTIILGVTPAIIESSQPSSSTPPRLPARDLPRLFRMLRAVHVQNVDEVPESVPPADAWSESADADKWRERRNHARIRRWEEPDFDLVSALPSFSMTNVGQSRNTRALNVIGRLMGVTEPPRSPTIDESSQYYRASFIVPRERSYTREKETRITRRRETNELLMRMGVGYIGGILEPLHSPPMASIHSDDGVHVSLASSWHNINNVESDSASDSQTAEDKDAAAMETSSDITEVELSGAAVPTVSQDTTIADNEDMSAAWGQNIESWSAVKEIADRALGTVVAAQLPQPTKTLDPIHVPWETVRQSWLAQRDFHQARKTWIKSAGVSMDEETEGNTDAEKRDVDEVIERIKRDPDLTAHEQRLLSCIVDASSMPTSFNQVHLPTHTIDSVRTLVSLPLLHPAAFASGVLKQHTMTGALLFGPPGTGKTLLVRALARESGARMMIVTPSDIYDMYVGEGEKLVRAVFTMARRLSPCVVFIDEIDAIFGARSSMRGSGSVVVHRGVITEFMQEMDGLKGRENSNIVVIGATNRPFDLDDAVLRRLPRRLMVDLPGEHEREEILKILLRDELLEDDVEVKALAKRTEGFSGSDLKHLCVSAALDAVKEMVKLPWSTERDMLVEPAISTSAAAHAVEALQDTLVDATDQAGAANETQPRKLGLRHFSKALREITPSSSEASTSLTELRKWNDEFGENGRTRKRMWGGNFGFIQEAQPRSS